MKHETEFIEIATEEYGVLYLRPYLRTHDILTIGEIDTNSLDSRGFTIRLVGTLLTSPSLDTDEIDSWQDSLLEKVATTWANEKQSPKWELESINSSF